MYYLCIWGIHYLHIFFYIWSMRKKTNEILEVYNNRNVKCDKEQKVLQRNVRYKKSGRKLKTENKNK